MKKKTLPLPCTDNEYVKVKYFCLKNNYKYIDLTKILLKAIERIDNEGNKDVQLLVFK